MSAPTIVAIPLDKIDVVDRLRAVDREGVELIRISMAERGLLQPILVRPIAEGRYRLIVGAHRLEAAKLLFQAGAKKWATIPAIVNDCDDDEAELQEIDENLRRRELSPYDEAEFLARRWTVWNRKHGTIRGGDRKSNRFHADLMEGVKKPHFFKEAAQSIGVDVETVRRAVKRRLKTSDEVWAALSGTDASQKAVLLDRLQRLSDPMAIIGKANAEFGGKIELALQWHRAKEEKKKKAPSTGAILKHVEACWPAWNPAQRKSFLAGVRALPK